MATFSSDIQYCKTGEGLGLAYLIHDYSLTRKRMLLVFLWKFSDIFLNLAFNKVNQNLLLSMS